MARTRQGGTGPIDLERDPGRNFLRGQPRELEPTLRYQGQSPVRARLDTAELCAELERKLYGTPYAQAISSYEGATYEGLVELYNKLQNAWRLRLQENR